MPRKKNPPKTIESLDKKVTNAGAEALQSPPAEQPKQETSLAEAPEPIPVVAGGQEPIPVHEAEALPVQAPPAPEPSPLEKQMLEAIKQLQDLYTANMSALFKRQEAIEAKQGTGGGKMPDWLAPIIPMIGPFLKDLFAPKKESGKLDMKGIISEAAQKRIEELTIKAVEAEVEQTLSIAKALREGRIWVKAGEPEESQPR